MKHTGIDLANGESRIGVTYTPEQWRRAKALEAAMKGIKNPAEFVKCADDLFHSLEKITTEQHWLSKLDAYKKARGKESNDQP